MGSGGCTIPFKAPDLRNHSQGEHTLYLKTLFTGFVLVLLCGCVPPFGQDVDEAEADARETLTQDTVNAPEVANGRVYQIGTFAGPLAEELSASFTFTPYDGTATDAPIFIADTAIDGLSDAQKAGIVATLQARNPVLLVHAGTAAVNTLIDLLHAEQSDFAMPAGVEYVDFFAVDTEVNGDLYLWTMYQPEDSAADPDGPGDQQGRVNLLVAWLDTNGNRDDGSAAARTAARASLKQAAADSGQELTDLASAFIKQDNFSRDGNNYQLSHYVYGCHSQATGDDWIYVQQRGIFYAGGAYKGRYERYPSNNAGEGAFWYLGNVDMDTGLSGYDYNTASVGLQQANPETANNVAQVTTGVSWNVGGEVSLSKEGPAVSVTGGVTISNSTTVNVQDCEVINRSASRGNNAAWSYQFKKCESWASIVYAHLYDPPKLATTTFQPFNQWIWRMSPSVRAAKPPMRVKLSLNLVYTVGKVTFLWASKPEHTLAPASWEYDVPFTFPPIAPK